MIANLAKTLADAEKNAKACAALKSANPSLSVEEAYRIQQTNIARRLEKGARVVGYKIGITSVALQEWLKVDQPDFGCLLDTMEVGDGQYIDPKALIAPKVEGEIAFVLKKPLFPKMSIGELIAAIDFALPAIEVIDSRIADWKIAYEDTIADNASSARFVLGTKPVRLRDLDVTLCGMRLCKNGRVVSTGVGAACLENPLNAVRWLADTLGELGTEVPAGTVILSGALGPVSGVETGDFVELSISGLGGCKVRF